MDGLVAVEADEDGSEFLGMIGLILPSLRLTLTAPSLLWSSRVPFFQSCMTDAALSQGLPKRIEYEELWEGKVITTKATKNLIPAILTGHSLQVLREQLCFGQLA